MNFQQIPLTFVESSILHIMNKHLMSIQFKQYTYDIHLSKISVFIVFFQVIW